MNPAIVIGIVAYVVGYLVLFGAIVAVHKEEAKKGTRPRPLWKAAIVNLAWPVVILMTIGGVAARRAT